ncbi:alpha/beta hydrolase [Levilactobacillus koreensis]|uniref:alpha/beta hydrolase n=1 Tax=Levilactobacillus koreensis TaxID=637971 RepID=UPI000ADCE93A|nr:dienelactone hydrolase family protein [Levilactobacillus koreensis]
MDGSDLVETAPGANTAPPLLLLQGTGGTNEEMLTFGRRLAPQSPLITIAGRIGVGAQRQYFQQTASQTANPEQISQEAAWLGMTVEQVCQQHRWSSDDLIVVGYSNGAAMAAYGVQMGLLPGQAAILFHPLRVATPMAVDRPGYRVWLSAGQHDPLVQVATVQQVAADCERAGMTTTVEVTGGTHQLTPQEVMAAHNWLAENY